MTRRGFALLTVLWLLAALSALGAATLARARLGATASGNRIVLTRAAWAREACAEILLARYAAHPSMSGLDTTDLGQGVWCRASVEDAASRADLNYAPENLLRALIGSDSLTDALLDWRDPDDTPRPHGAELNWYEEHGGRRPRNGPLAAVEELLLVRGFDSVGVAKLGAVLTVRGAARIDVNSAPPALLSALPGIGPEAVDWLLKRRAAGRSVVSTDELLAFLSPDGRRTLLSRFQDYSFMAAYAPAQVVFHLEGGIHGRTAVSASRITAIPLPSRLAVIRREVQ
jgi:type II secretory pathway component PulK